MRGTPLAVELGNMKYAVSHGAQTDGFLGLGMLYHALSYMACKESQPRILCLGSGSGFVPRIMALSLCECQKEKDGSLILVDADIGPWGRPDYRDMKIPSQVEFHFIKSTTEEFFATNKTKFDYIHIDADHSYQGCLFDLLNSMSILNPHGWITLHDSLTCTNADRTVPAGVREAVYCAPLHPDWQCCEFCLGHGCFLVSRKAESLPDFHHLLK